MLHGQHHFDETGHAGGFERVPDMSFHAPDWDLLSGRQVLTYQRRQCGEFGRVANLRAGGMSLYVVESADIVWIGVCPLDCQRLPFLSRRPQAFAFAVAGHTNALDDGPNAVAVGNRSRERLHDKRHVAFGRHEPIGRFAKRTRTRVTYRLGRRKEDQAIRFAVRSSAHNRLIDATLQQCPGANGHRLQRRRARRINDEVWPIEPQSFLYNLGDG